MQKFYSELVNEGLSAQTMKHQYALLRGAIAQAFKWDMLSKNVMDGVIPPKVSKPELRILTSDEALRLLQHVGRADYHIPVHLVLYTGLHRSEVRGLFWSALNLDESSFRMVRTMVAIPGETAHLDDPKVAAISEGGGLRRGEC